MTERQDQFSQDIQSSIGSIVVDIDKNMIATQQSQQDLGQEIDRLIAELQVFNGIAEPPRLHVALTKLMDAKKKLQLSTRLLDQTSQRLVRMEGQLKQDGRLD
ncbi:hypothetical protein BC941DRAFT_476959 [Chlamydoabsidia padenii]|nr:hypothetical protein BC941DRAFT_476959 [Chlamydoabsidia padenii]